MKLGDALGGAYRTLLARPANLLPLYFLGIAVPAAARVLPFAVIGVILGVLWTTGRLEALDAALADAAPISIDDPQGSTELNQATIEEIGTILSPVEIAIPVGISIVLMIVLILVLNAIISAGQTHAAFATVEDRAGVSAAVTGIGRDGGRFVGVLLIEIVTHLVVLGGIGAVIVLLGIVSPLIAVLAGTLLGVTGLLAAGAVRVAFAFVPVVLVIENEGIAGALRRTGQYLRAYPGAAVGYGLFAFVLYAAIVVLGILLAAANVGGVSGLVLLILVPPLLDLTKVLLYEQASTTPAVALEGVHGQPTGIGSRLRRALGDGLRELAAFSRGHLGLIGISAGIFVLAGYLGFSLGAIFEGTLTASITERLASGSPVGDFLFYATNNWQVAVAQTYAGLGGGIPTVAALVLNGVNIGVLYQLEVEPLVLLAFILPHGLIELPGLILSGAVGLYLGVVSWSHVLGTSTRSRLVTAIKQAYTIMVGMVVVFLLAALIEAFISPYYWRLLGL